MLKLKQVAVRMDDALHDKALATSKRIGVSFGELVRVAVAEKLAKLAKKESK
jgi:hypothetical protein